MEIIYNCGYHTQFGISGKVTKKRYVFRKTFVTTVDDADGEEFLKLTANDVNWCDQNDKTIPPFMKLEDWCACKPGTFRGLKTIYDPVQYSKEMHL